MFEEVISNYFHPGYNIGLQDIKNACLLSSLPVHLSTCIFRVFAIYRDFLKQGTLIRPPQLIPVSNTAPCRHDFFLCRAVEKN